jgi:hypothetical protein
MADPNTTPNPAAAPAAGAPLRKVKKKKAPPRPAIRIPRDADELIGMKRPELERLGWELAIRLGKVKRHRADLATTTPTPDAALTRANGQIAELGALLHVVNERRGQLRRAARLALGKMPERCEAIAGAVDSMVHGGLHHLLMKEAERILKRAAADLAEGDPIAGGGAGPISDSTH